MAIRTVLTRCLGERVGKIGAEWFSAPDDDLLALHRIPVTGQESLLDSVCRLYATQSVGTDAT